jgi:acyl-CoA synthetase (AMP-forming)/AMP-acid ligase II
MDAATDMLRRASERADALRAGYREAGAWSADPVDVVRAAAERGPSKQAVVARVGQLTYAELDQRVDRACHALTDAGVEPAMPVLLVVDNDIESVVAIHATLRADAVVLLVPRSAGPAQIADITGRTGVSVGVAPNGMDAAAELEWIQLPTEGPVVPVVGRRAADEPSFVLFTSGTTSKPKGVIHSIATLMKASVNYIDAEGLASDDRILLISPLASVAGILQALFVAPMLTAPVILEDHWDPTATCELLVSQGATWYGGPDRLLDRMLDAAGERRVPLRAVCVGGTMLDRRIVERIEDDFGITVIRAYGSSEVPVSTSGLRSEPRNVRHGDDGCALDGVEIRVGSTNEPTECCIRGPHMFLGYTDADDDAQAFDDGWFRTGDMAELTAGRVRIIGRIKDIVIRNGMKIAVAEVEEAIGRIDGVRECAAYSVRDPTTGERLAAAVVMDPGSTVSLNAVADVLVSAGLPKYKLPEELVFWNEPLPVNANGKVERNTLHERSKGRPRDLAKRLG